MNRRSAVRAEARGLLLLAVLLLDPAWAGPEGRAPAEPPRASPAALRLEITADHEVSIEAHGVPLDVLLEEMARQAGLVILAQGSFDRPVTVTFDGLPLPRALSRILSRESFALQYSNTGDAGASRRLWLFSEDAGAPVGTPGELATRVEPADITAPWMAQDPIGWIDGFLELAGGDAERWTRELERAATSHADPFVRVEALNALGELGSADSAETFERALLDPALRVREAAVFALADARDERAIPALAVALADSEATIREEAVWALAEIGGASVSALLRRALQDPDPAVRESAAEVLDRDPGR